MNFFSDLLESLQGESTPSTSDNLPDAESIITGNRIPFKCTSEAFPADQKVADAVDQIRLTFDHFRSSTRLKSLLNDIVANICLYHCWGKQSVKVRLSAFVDLLVHQLCVPHIMSLYGVGVDPMGSTSDANSFLTQARYILVESFTLFRISEEIALDGENDGCLDERRFHLLFKMLELKCSSILPNTMTVQQHAPQALEAMSRHILSVTAVTQCIANSIDMVVARMLNTLNTSSSHSSYDSNTTNTNSNQSRAASLLHEHQVTLEVIVVDYFKWLRDMETQLVKLCRTEEILAAVDSSVRAWLRAECYSSSLELLYCYQSKYKPHLTHMPVPLQPYRCKDIEQAKKDVARDRILMNRVEYISGRRRISETPGAIANSSSSSDTADKTPIVHLFPPPKDATPLETITLTRALKKEISKVLAYLFEIDAYSTEQYITSSNSNTPHVELHKSLKAPTSTGTAGAATNTSSTSRILGNGVEADTDPYQSDGTDSESADFVIPGVASTTPRPRPPPTLNRLKPAKTAEFSASETLLKVPTTMSINAETTSNFGSKLGCTTLPAAQLPHTASPTGTCSEQAPVPIVPSITSSMSSAEMCWQAELLDTLYSYTLLAASRTFAAGDAFLILNDLYGGTGLSFCPWQEPRNNNRSSSRNVQHSIMETDAETADVMIAITASGVKVTLKERYALFDNSTLDQCTNPSLLQPLMKFECTTTTILILDPAGPPPPPPPPPQSSSSSSSSSSAAAAAAAPTNAGGYSNNKHNKSSNYGGNYISTSTGTTSTAIVTALDAAAVIRLDKQLACEKLFRLIISNPEQLCHRAVTIEPYQ